jgi:multiple sugar transport system ATP-binding protein
MASLTLDKVSKIYGPRRQAGVLAVHDLTMRIDDGEIVGLLGSSGCGKTSTLRMIAGFESVTQGEIRIGDRRLNDLPPAQRGVAMAFEGYALYPPLRIEDNIAFGLLRARMPKTEVARKVAEIARLLEIENILGSYPSTLSGGQQQRVSLARALIRGADLHLLDEPMSQLEPQLRAVLRARIKDYLIEHKMTTVFVTHDQTEAVALADRIAIMEAGELQQFASPEDLKENPANLFVASFVGEPPMNLFPAEVDSNNAIQVINRAHEKAFSIDLDGAGDVAAQILYPGRKIHLGIRPHRIRVGPAGVNDGANAVVRGMLLSNQWLGDQSHLGIDVGGCFMIAVSDRDVALRADEAVDVSLPFGALHVFDRDDERALLHGMRRAEV